MNLVTILEEFHQIATNPKVQFTKYKDAGKKVILMAPVYTPNEIIHSMGLVPMGAWGGDLPIQDAKKYFPAFICSIIQSALELGMRGTYDGAYAMVIPSLCDSLKVLGENWKYAVPSIPFIPMTYPQNRKPDFGVDYTMAGYQRVIADLEKITNEKFSKKRLEDSIEVYNTHNQVMREFSKVCAKTGVLSAKERSDVYKSAFFLLVEEHTKLVRTLITLMNEEKPKEEMTRVLITGILADAPSLLDIFDEHHVLIAADDLAACSRQYRVDTVIEEDSLKSLAIKFASMDYCSVLYDPKKSRVEFLIEEAIAIQAKGMIHVQTKFCDPEEFDFPILKKACEKVGIPMIQIETDRQMDNYEQARTIISTFVEMVE